jgi:hypothetical protein
MTENETKKNPISKGINEAVGRLKEAWDENPIGVLLAGAAFFTGAAKFIDSFGSYQSKRAYAKEAEERAKTYRTKGRYGRPDFSS